MERRRFRLAVMSVAQLGSPHHVAAQGRGVPGSMAFFSAREGETTKVFNGGDRSAVVASFGFGLKP